MEELVGTLLNEPSTEFKTAPQRRNQWRKFKFLSDDYVFPLSEEVKQFISSLNDETTAYKGKQLLNAKLKELNPIQIMDFDLWLLTWEFWLIRLDLDSHLMKFILSMTRNFIKWFSRFWTLLARAHRFPNCTFLCTPFGTCCLNLFIIQVFLLTPCMNTTFFQ